MCDTREMKTPLNAFPTRLVALDGQFPGTAAAAVVIGGKQIGILSATPFSVIFHPRARQSSLFADSPAKRARATRSASLSARLGALSRA